MRTALIHPDLGRANGSRDPALALAEAQSLVTALDVDLVWSEVTVPSRIVAGTFFAPGKIEEIGAQARPIIWG